jgi:hypothetical protein
VNEAEEALVRAFLGCHLALESLDELPPETAEAVEEPLREFCRRLEPFVGHLVNGKEPPFRKRG